MHQCPRCQSHRLIKNGSATDKPKKQCKACGYQFTRTTPRGKPLTIKVNAVLWYLSGVSMSRIAFLSRVSVQAVLTGSGPSPKTPMRSQRQRRTSSCWNRLSCGIV
jgi:transposase-like protein